ncbi:hypothetical protein R1sor_007930 [Riccia sorocarpa]|uniref:Myb/SANT-like DNA-binding domain-containing protein n=1 Tax=Riccia sorocarpa TaxID=122646 RepID=A0ABD3HY76_9MARC
MVRDSQAHTKKPRKSKKQPSDAPVPRKQKLVWSKESEQLFLDLYEDSYFNHCQQGNVSQDQWRVLASSMNERISVTPPFEPQILRNKLDSLVKKYKVEKQKQSQTGAEPSAWELYEQMHRIRNPSPKEQGIPGSLDGGHDAVENNGISIDLTISDEYQEESSMTGAQRNPADAQFTPAAGLSFTEMLEENIDDVEVIFPTDNIHFTRPSTPVHDERVTTPPRNNTAAATHEKESSEKSFTSPRSKACSSP